MQRVAGGDLACLCGRVSSVSMAHLRGMFLTSRGRQQKDFFLQDCRPAVLGRNSYRSVESLKREAAKVIKKEGRVSSDLFLPSGLQVEPCPVVLVGL